MSCPRTRNQLKGRVALVVGASGILGADFLAGKELLPQDRWSAL